MKPDLKIPFLLTIVTVGLLTAAIGLEARDLNLFGWVSFILGTAICLTGAFSLAFEQFWQRLVPGLAGRGIWIILTAFLLILLVSPLEFLFLPASLPRTDILQVISLVVLCAGAGLAGWALRLRITTSSISQNGPSFVFGGLCMAAIGIWLGYSSLIGLVLFILLFLPGIVYQIRLEMKSLV
jgi:hypothetical protein